MARISRFTLRLVMAMSLLLLVAIPARPASAAISVCTSIFTVAPHTLTTSTYTVFSVNAALLSGIYNQNLLYYNPAHIDSVVSQLSPNYAWIDRYNDAGGSVTTSGWSVLTYWC